MEILAIVTVTIKTASIVGQSVLGLYFVKTAIQYVSDYRDSIAKERS